MYKDYINKTLHIEWNTATKKKYDEMKLNVWEYSFFMQISVKITQKKKQINTQKNTLKSVHIYK